MEATSVQTRSNTVAMGTDGIVRISAKSSERIEIAEAQAIIAAMKVVTAGKKAPMFIDLRQTGQLSPAAEKCFAQPGTFRYVRAGAIVGRSVLDRALGNVFLMLTSRSRDGVPIKVFGSEADAMAWLRDPR